MITRQAHRPADMFTATALAHPAILVADDFRPTLESCVDALTCAGYAVRGVSDGRSAIERLRAERYEVVICNYRMEGITGLDVLESARRHAPGTLVVLLSGMPSDAVNREARARGVFAVLAKPLAMSDLLATVRDALTAISGVEERAVRSEGQP
jgi:DNA-binding NtrC family response regulator